MGVNFPSDESDLIGAWLESFVWGEILRYTPHVYTLASVHVILGLAHIVRGFITLRGSIDPNNYLGDTAEPLDVAGNYIYITNLIVGDSVVVWRLYVVWGKRLWAAAIPIAMLVGTAIAGYGSITQYFFPNVQVSATVDWGTSMFAISLSTNAIVTVMTAARIWYVSRTNNMMTGQQISSYSRLILLILESGLTVTAAKLVEFVLFETCGNGYTGNMAINVPMALMPQLTAHMKIQGLIPTVIVLLVNTGYTQKDEYYSQHTGEQPQSLVFVPGLDAQSDTNFTSVDFNVTAQSSNVGKN
ncbi:hypothetical protein WOLCODRAFT_17409 [Wolfiporia cocos MD-104 SS10]|uniref:Uncharacterized protein n=1 Tax=Wolfiporia cocos (strain MD-104) TaxID=742152 RepID=A0A2H3JIE5_WOLCO|nr:hypothetical protein WOLCODRAFT_17409 [Wolfiporia cocos MD-104 SS10]